MNNHNADTTSHPAKLNGPALKTAALFAAGILAGSVLNIPPLTAILIVALLAVITAATFRLNATGAICSAFLAFGTGFLAISVQYATIEMLPIDETILGEIVTVKGTVDNSIRRFGDALYCDIDVSRLYADGKWTPRNGSLPCVKYSSSAETDIHPGSEVFATGTISRRYRPITISSLPIEHPSETYPFRITADTVTVAETNRYIIMDAVYSLRSSLSDKIGSLEFKGNSGLVKTLLIGERSGLDYETREQFARAGAAHILAVSGLHVGIIVILLSLLMRPLPVMQRAKTGIVLVFILIYAALCGFRAPITRAILLFGAAYAVLFVHRIRDNENILAAAFIIILAFDPSALFTVSFQLSFAATWAIVLFIEPIWQYIPVAAKRNIATKYVAGILVVSLIASTATIPITAFYFGEIPLFAIPVSVPAIFLVTIIIGGGILSLVLSFLLPFAPQIADITATGTGYLAEGLALLTESVSSLPYATIPGSTFTLGITAAALIWLFIFSRNPAQPITKRALVYIPLLTLLIAVWYPLAGLLWGESKDSVVFFNVGQGDAALVSTRDGLHFLIDTGPEYDIFSPAEHVILPSLETLGIEELDAVFISHLHDDHIGGLATILDAIPVRRLYCSVIDAPELRTMAAVPVAGLHAGDVVDYGDCKFTVFSPNISYPDELFKEENNSSLVGMFRFTDGDVLFTGDCEPEMQSFISLWGKHLNADILKVPHHGAAGLDSALFVSAAPIYSMLSCGAGNRFGHPHSSTGQMLGICGEDWYRTDLHGTTRVFLPSMILSFY